MKNIARRSCAMALISFTAGVLVTVWFTQVRQVSAESERMFELRIYHAVPGKVRALESRFRDTASKLLAKHDLKVVGYWVPEGSPGWENTFVYVVAHDSREKAKSNWAAMFSDPAFQEMMKSEKQEKLVEKVDSAYMGPTDFSPMK